MEFPTNIPFTPMFSSSYLTSANNVSRCRLELGFLCSLYDDYKANVENSLPPINFSTQVQELASQLELSFIFKVRSVRDKSQTDSAPMFSYPLVLDEVIKIMYSIAPNPHIVPWRNITSIELQSMHLIEDIMELAIFLPQLKTFKSKLVLPSNTAVVNHSPADHRLQNLFGSETLAVCNSTEKSYDDYLNMSKYEISLRMRYKPLLNSLVSKLRLNYEITGSALCLRSTERLCKWYFPRLCDYRFESGFHEITNGTWTCKDLEFCNFHATF
ncbi:hypothetical protein BX667DRAFT_508291 [Coemansia mojavensis]|nr:hypothetical protein BX667DRAFT_508291 [Coemansia mojavensis]